jgi:hypothetical protein
MAWQTGPFDAGGMAGGPDENKANREMGGVFDRVLLLSLSSRNHVPINFDDLQNRTNCTPSREVHGIAGAARFHLTGRHPLHLRLEWPIDNTGTATGTGQPVKQLTATNTYELLDRFSG